MSLYYFHVYDGRETLDHEGTELLDLQEAQQETMKLAGELLTYEGERMVANGSCLIIVKDGQGLTQLRLDLTVALEARTATSIPLRGC